MITKLIDKMHHISMTMYGYVNRNIYCVKAILQIQCHYSLKGMLVILINLKYHSPFIVMKVYKGSVEFYCIKLSVEWNPGMLKSMRIRHNSVTEKQQQQQWQN